ncbi:MAG: fibronectin type III domain-containing protein [Lachnospiraceae bacterium]|nr:fibronectin type III domain-containing protein [Lachnospiraceae bacterium]
MKKRFIGFMRVFLALALVLSLIIPACPAKVKAAASIESDYFSKGLDKIKPAKPVIDTGEADFISATVKQSDEVLKLLRDYDQSLAKRDEEEAEYCDIDLKYDLTALDIAFQYDVSVDGSAWQYSKKWDNIPEFESYSGGFTYLEGVGAAATDNTITHTIMDAGAADSGVLKKAVKSGVFDLNSHVFKVRFRYVLMYYNMSTDEWVYKFSDWSDETSFGKTTNQVLEIPDEFPVPDMSAPQRELNDDGVWASYVSAQFDISHDITDLETTLSVAGGIFQPLMIVVEAAVDDPTEKKFEEVSLANAVWMSVGRRGIALNGEGYTEEKTRILLRTKILCEDLDKSSKWDYAIGQVKNLKVKTTKTTSLKLTWSKVDGAESYEIYDGNNKLVATSKTNSVTIKKLKAGTGYDFKVRAVVDKVFVGLFSDVLKCPTKPKKVGISSLKSGTADTVLAKYKKVTGTGYELQFATDKKFKNNLVKAEVKDIKTVSYTAELVKASGKTYYVRVRAYITYGGQTVYGAWSKVKSLKVK